MAIAVLLLANLLLLVLWMRRKEWIQLRRWKRWCFFSAWNLIAVLLVAEVILPFIPLGFADVKYSGTFSRRDPILHHSFIPGGRGTVSSPDYKVEYYINSLGLRDREFPLAKPIGQKRILLLGDSYVEGMGLEWEETIGQRLESYINGKSASPWQVINGGVSSYSPTLEYLYLMSKGLALQPDLVVVVVDNTDVWDDWRYGRIVRLSEEGEIKPAQYPEPTTLNKLEESVKELVLRRFRTYWLWWWSKLTLLRWWHRGDITFDRLAHVWGRMKGDWEPHFRRSARYIALFREQLADRNIPLLVVVFPYEHMVVPPEGLTEPYSTPFFGWVEVAASGRLSAFLDTTPAFRAHGTAGLYYPVDGHFTPEGASVISKEIGEKLLELGWVRGESRRQ